MSKNTVLIENPIAGGARFTSRKAADRYFKEGRARLTISGDQVSMRFIEQNHRNVSAISQARITAHGYDTMPRRYLKLKEVRHIPCTQARNAFTLPTQSRVAPAGRSGKVAVLIDDGEFAWPEAA